MEENNNENPLDFLRKMTEVIEREHRDIAPEEKEFSNLTFAIANSCGEAGREYYKRICAHWSKGVNDPQLLDQKYDYALKEGRGGNGLGTVFHLFEQAGLKLPETTDATHATYNKCSNMEEKEVIRTSEMDDEAPAVELPRFNQKYEWPWPINEILKEAESEEEHDILLLGSLTAIGISLCKKVGTLYGKKVYYPAIYLIVTAPSSKGKGGVAPLKQFLIPIHEEIKATSVKDKPKMLIIPGNNTSAGINANIMNNNGTGIIIEPEADTLTAALRGQFGNFSDVLRKGFDHEGLAYNRKLDNDFRESLPLALALLICGTPGQIKALLSSAENGLFARIVYYYLQGTDEWVNKFNYTQTETINEKFYRLGVEWKKTVDALKGMELITLCLSESQIEAFTKEMAALKEKAVKMHGDSMAAYVNREAISLLRIMSIVSLLRVKDEILTPPALGEMNVSPQINIDDADFFEILSMAEVIYTHATRILSFLPEVRLSYNSSPEKERLLTAMANVFTRKQWNDEATRMGVKPGTSKKWLERLQKRNVVAALGNATFRKL